MRTDTRLALLAAGVVAIGLWGGACGGDEPRSDGTAASTTEPTAAPAPEPTATTEPTSEPTTTAVPAPEPTATTTPTAEPASVGPTLLVASEGGLDLWSGGALTPLIAGEAIESAVPDLRGGVLLATGQETGAPATQIEAMTSVSSDRTVVFDEPDARWVILEDVAWIRERATLLYRVGRTLENDCGADIECLWQYQVDHLMLRDLETGQETNLGVIGSFESSRVQFRFGGTRAAVTLWPYGAPHSCVGILPAAALLDGTAPDAWIGEGGSWREEVLWLGPGACGGHAGCPPQSACVLPARVGLSDDGTRAALAWSRPGSDPGVDPQPLVVSVVDLSSATVDEVWQAVVGDPADAPTWIDFDGESVVIGREREGEPLSPVLVRPDGTVTTLAIEGVAHIWVTAPPPS